MHYKNLTIEELQRYALNNDENALSELGKRTLTGEYKEYILKRTQPINEHECPECGYMFGYFVDD